MSPSIPTTDTMNPVPTIETASRLPASASRHAKTISSIAMGVNNKEKERVEVTNADAEAVVDFQRDEGKAEYKGVMKGKRTYIKFYSGKDRLAKQVAKVEELPLSKTSTTQQALTSGLDMLRNLGGKKWEVTPISALTDAQMNTEKAALDVQSVPGTGELVNSIKGDLDSKTDMIILADQIACHDVFPFQKLPPELRDMVYKLVIGSKRVFVVALSMRCPHYLSQGWILMRVCRQFAGEVWPLFWKQTFRIDNLRLLPFIEKYEEFRQNVVKFEYHWSGTVREKSNFIQLAKFPSLKFLYISLNPNFPNPRAVKQVNRNKLCQEDESLKMFSHVAGFDQLIMIRGLEKVAFSIGHWGWWSYGFTARVAAVKVFEDFLMRTLTQPPQPMVEKKVIKPRTKKRGPRKAKKDIV